MSRGGGNASGAILFALIAVGVVVVYATQFGAPDTSGAESATADLTDQLPKNPDGVADATAKGLQPIVAYPIIAGALFLGFVLYRIFTSPRYRVGAIAVTMLAIGFVLAGMAD